jgi:hypothetical protein
VHDKNNRQTNFCYNNKDKENRYNSSRYYLKRGKRNQQMQKIHIVVFSSFIRNQLLSKLVSHQYTDRLML